MKVKTLFSLLFIGIITQIYSQINVSSVVGISDNGIANSTNFSIPVSSKMGLDFGIYYNSNDYELNNQLEVPIEVFTGQIGATKKVNFLSSNSLTTAIVGGASVGVEILNNGRTELSNGTILNEDSGFIYGGYLGIQSNFKISQKWDLVARYNGFLHNSDIASNKFILGLGLGYNF